MFLQIQHIYYSRPRANMSDLEAPPTRPISVFTDPELDDYKVYLMSPKGKSEIMKYVKGANYLRSMYKCLAVEMTQIYQEKIMDPVTFNRIQKRLAREERFTALGQAGAHYQQLHSLHEEFLGTFDELDKKVGPFKNEVRETEELEARNEQYLITIKRAKKTFNEHFLFFLFGELNKLNKLI